MSLIQSLIASESHQSPFEQAIRQLPIPILRGFEADALPEFVSNGLTLTPDGDQQTREMFPGLTNQSQNQVLVAGSGSDRPRGHRIAVLFSGGPAAGGHNVVAGIRKALGSNNVLFGVKAGPKGLLEGELFEIPLDTTQIQNTGGFDYLGSDRTKIKTDDQLAQVVSTVNSFNLTGIIIIGGDDSNTNAAVLAEHLLPHHCAVIGVPKTIDGDLQVGEWVPISFGFDTATKIYAELVGNILQDTPSSRKYWHFVKLMGRSASHVALEVALQTHPAVTLISEEVADKKQSLSDIVDHIATVVVDRAKRGLNHGVVLIPEGIIEFIPEMHALIQTLNDGLATHEAEEAVTHLPDPQRALFESLPEIIRQNLLLDRDSHGNLQVSQIPSEVLFIELTRRRVNQLSETVRFSPLSHFFGYEGRCGAPTRFDAIYTFNLGLVAGALALRGHTGYMAAVTQIFEGGLGAAVPLTGLITVERRGGKSQAVIQKALVTLNSPAFQFFASRRSTWAQSDVFSSPGPRQLWGELGNQVPATVALNQSATGLGFRIGATQ